ncbi:hypothetical protein FQA39_LY02384 [Lamprigera yunnana]|nr:hypothetical protein FQA39_LY02384 [Lamprigera yunnana]
MLRLPSLFVKNGVQARRDAKDMLKKHLQLLKIKEHGNVIDVGCGPGNVTYDVLYPLLPKSINKLVGIDVSPKMIKFAKESYENSTVKFVELDILGDKMPEDFVGHFDHLVSTYCLHLVNDQRKALKNMHIMLKPEGNILLNFMSKTFIFDIYNRMAEKERWKPYFKNLGQVEPPTASSSNGRQYFERLLKEIGFVTQSSFESKKIYVYPEQLFADLVLTVSVFDIPKHLEEEFIWDHMQHLKDNNYVHTDADDKLYYHAPYTLLTFCATKSFKYC